jgi:hypothetical protein
MDVPGETQRRKRTMDKLAFVFLLGAALALCSCILTDK